MQEVGGTVRIRAWQSIPSDSDRFVGAGEKIGQHNRCQANDQIVAKRCGSEEVAQKGNRSARMRLGRD